MPRGYPDGGVPGYESAVGNVDISAAVDMAALGFARQDGRGRVIASDTFRDGLTQWVAAIGTWRVVVGSLGGAIPSHAGPVYALCTLGAGDNGVLTRSLYVGTPARLGLEHSLYVPDLAAGTVTLGISYTRPNDLTGQYTRWEVRYTRATGAWQLRPSGVPVALAPQFIYGAWAPVKLVVEPATGKFIRLVLGQSVTDLTAYTGEILPGGLPGAAVVQLAAADAGAGSTICVGYHVVTTDEP